MLVNPAQKMVGSERGGIKPRFFLDAEMYRTAEVFLFLALAAEKVFYHVCEQ